MEFSKSSLRKQRISLWITFAVIFHLPYTNFSLSETGLLTTPKLTLFSIPLHVYFLGPEIYLLAVLLVLQFSRYFRFSLWHFHHLLLKKKYLFHFEHFMQPNSGCGPLYMQSLATNFQARIKSKDKNLSPFIEGEQYWKH